MRKTTMWRSMLAVVALASLSGAAQAAPPAKPVVVSQTTTTTVFGDDACPTPENGDIVVCARLPESERYRIPKKLRKHKAERVEQSWSSRVATLDEAARPERPDSCSAVGSGGQTGCTAAMLRQWSDDRRAQGKQVGIPF